jgi:HEAT repeat protein
MFAKETSMFCFRRLFDPRLALLSLLTFSMLVLFPVSGLLADEVRDLSGSLMRGTTQEKVDAAAALARIGTDEALAALRPALADRDETVCKAAVGAVASFSRQEAVDMLYSMFRRYDSDMKVHVVASLAYHCKECGELKVFAMALGDESADVRMKAMEALSKRRSNEEVVNLLLRKIRGQQLDVQCEIVRNIPIDTNSEAELQILQTGLADQQGEVVLEAVRKLGNMKMDADNKMEMARRVKCNDVAVQHELVAIFKEIGSDKAVLALQGIINKGDNQTVIKEDTIS